LAFIKTEICLNHRSWRLPGSLIYFQALHQKLSVCQSFVLSGPDFSARHFFLWKCSFLSSIQTHPLDTFICHFIKSFLWLKSVMKVFELLTKTCHSAVNFLYSFPISVIFDNKTKKERRKDLSILKVLSKFFSIKKISFENFRNLCWE